jgi:hypothetical protein
MSRIFPTVLFLAGWAAAQTFVPLFDGKSLAGWATQGQGKWEVKEGAIHGSGEASNPKNAWLISEKRFRDFVFRFRFRGVIGNSGLQFRSIQDAEDVAGVQVDLDAGKTSGSLYELLIRNGQYAGSYLVQPPEAQVKALYRPDDWNLMELKVQGKRAEVALNGTWVVKHDLARVEPEGFFAFQLHDRQMTRLSVKDLEISEGTVVSLRSPRGSKLRLRPVEAEADLFPTCTLLGRCSPFGSLDPEGNRVKGIALTR